MRVLVFTADNFVRFADKSWLTCSNFFASSVFQTKAETPEAKCGLSPNRSIVESTISIVFEFDFFFEAFNQLETAVQNKVTFKSGGSSDLGKILTKKSLI